MTDAPPACSEPGCNRPALHAWYGRPHGNAPFAVLGWRYACGHPEHQDSVRRLGSITRYEGLVPGETARTVKE